MSDNWVHDTYLKAIEQIDKVTTNASIITDCMNTGEQFIRCFDKVYRHKSELFKQTCKEMQSILDRVYSLRLKADDKLLSSEQLFNWFFRASSTPGCFLNDWKEVDAYLAFVAKLQSNKSLTVAEALKEYDI